MTTYPEPQAGSVYAAALRGEPCVVHGLDAYPRALPVSFWGGPADASDRALLEHCVGPTLDIGCGPGRMTQHLAQRGIGVLGIDVVDEAVRQTRARGAGALNRDVYGQLPGEGRWGTALLADGNIGIGGDPRRLLGRVAELLAPIGRVVLDLAAPGSGLRTVHVTLECRGRRSGPFPWAVIGPEAIGNLAADTGFSVTLTDSIDGRWFAVLDRRS